MNCFSYLQHNLYLQQQNIHQQMLMYNQMLSAYISLTQPMQTSNNLIPEEAKCLNSQNSKQEDTPLVQPQSCFSLKKKIRKASQKQQQKLTEESKPQKNKVFLSMLDIKEAQYKKSKVLGEEGLLQCTILQNNVKE